MKNKKNKITNEFNELLSDIEKTNTMKDRYEIITLNEKYFEKFTKKTINDIESEILKIFIYNIVKSVVIETKTQLENDQNYFKNKYTIEEYITIIINFYEYFKTILIFIKDHYIDTLLDAYNNKIIDKKFMSQCVIKIQQIKPNIEGELNDLEINIDQLRKMLELIESNHANNFNDFNNF